MAGELPRAVPINDEEALKLAEELVATHRTDLSRPEQYAAALSIAHSVKILENHQAANAQVLHAREKVGRDLAAYLTLPPELGGPTMPEEDETQTHFIKKIIDESKEK